MIKKNTRSSLHWNTKLGDGTRMDLRAFGEQIGVETLSFTSFVELSALCELHESECALRAMRAGLMSIVPGSVFRLLTWHQLEEKVCGAQGIDLAILKINTEYDDGIRPEDEHIVFFWKALRSFSESERSMFLRFVWARQRLPFTQNMVLEQKFKVQVVIAAYLEHYGNSQSAIGDGPCKNPDGYLPKAHTCFFSLNLPKYSSEKVMANKLRYAMFNCMEMDADFKLADTEISGWSP